MLSLVPLRSLFSEQCLRPFPVRLFLRLGLDFILLLIILRACREVGGVLVYHSYNVRLLSSVVPHISHLIADFTPLARLCCGHLPVSTREVQHHLPHLHMAVQSRVVQGCSPLQN